MAERRTADPAEKSHAKAVEIIEESDGLIVVHLGHGWKDVTSARHVDALKQSLERAGDSARVKFECQDFRQDAPVTLPILLELIQAARARKAQVDLQSLPAEVYSLMNLATAVAPHRPEEQKQSSLIENLGRKTISILKDSGHFIEFLGELTVSLGKLLIGKARFRKPDFWVTLQECGVNALPIVTLLALLTGTILGFVGAMQLRKFGATIYMTDLVGLSMARELACIMTGVIMSGRTGASFAAQIGSMNVNQEVEALETFGLSPMEFLVLPRVVAMVLMMPLLTLFADISGWIGGFLVALPVNIGAVEYWNQLNESLTLIHIGFGLVKSFFFGIIVAATGCYYGLLSGRSSAAVGQATTKAVVAGITWIIIADAIFAVIAEILDI